jgi:hypothetical protein
VALKKIAPTGRKKRDDNATHRLAREPHHCSKSENAARFITVRVPLTIGKRGGRKIVLSPSGTLSWMPQRPHVDNTLIKALARAHRWKRMMESGSYSSVAELAAEEKINDSYVCRMLRLTLLAPEIVESIMAGRQPAALQLQKLVTFKLSMWKKQRMLFASPLKS